MLIRDWMTKKVVTVTPDVSMMTASRLMKEQRVGRLPVVDGNGRLTGMLSDRDIKEASPSRATSLDMHELYYLLSEIKVKDIMTRHPVAMHGEDPVEQAALVMVEKHFGGIPIVDADNMVVGIITDSDIFKVFINITGASAGGLQMAFEINLKDVKLHEVLAALHEHGARVLSVLTSGREDDSRMLYIRVCDMQKDAYQTMITDMQRRFGLLYWHPQT